jgi:phosphate transport system permease protein
MTDVAARGPSPHQWDSTASQKLVKKRYRADRLLQLFGLGAIWLAIGLLGILVFSLVQSGYKAFVQSKVQVELPLDPSKIDPANPDKANYRAIVRDAFRSLFPDVKGRTELRDIDHILSSEARFIVRDYVVDHPDVIGNTITLALPLSDPFDQLHKNVIPARIDALTRQERERFETLQNRGVVIKDDARAKIRTDIFIDPQTVDREKIAESDFSDMLEEGFNSLFEPFGGQAHQSILTKDAADTVRDYVAANPDVIGKTIQLAIPVSEHYQTLAEGKRPTIVNPRFGSAEQIERFRGLEQRGLISMPFNWELFLNSDSRFPERAGLWSAIVGSFYTLLVCFLISFPVGIAAAVYLEEFAVKNRLTDLIEVNINNLAAVPSVVFGLLGLAVFLGFFGLPRSAPLVGGMVLSLMTLPTIIIATRAALKAVPPSIREAALGVGASKHQVMMHHVLPLAMPGILTGTIIGLAQALGETAPLLLIGMNAFITSDPGGILEPATALPTQIYSWADSPERGFVSRTSAAILVLLGFLLVMNAIAIFLRQKFERKW